MSLLSITNLSTHFQTSQGTVKAVDHVDLDIQSGEIVGLVGESGSGKSVLSMSILRLISAPGKLVSGAIMWQRRDGEMVDLARLPMSQMRSIRGSEIAMIFQEPMTALNPVMTIGRQLEEVLELHTKQNAADRQRTLVEMLQLVGISSPLERLAGYPHELSGGMRQRIMIAMALACKPALLIADEPTTALDVTIQAQILSLLRELQRKLGMALLLITHDLGVVAQMADRVAVMYAGSIVEIGPTADIFAAPRHPYTEALLAAIPSLVPSARHELVTIPGQVPNLAALPVGCRFQDRCQYVQPRCRAELPPLDVLGSPQHRVRCYYPVAEPKK